MISGTTQLIGIVGHPVAQVRMPGSLNAMFLQTGQDLALKINGAAAASQRIPNNGVFMWANPTVAGGTPITAVSLTTTAIQSGAGYINYWVFGDPTS